jgi:hypothetical protein
LPRKKLTIDYVDPRGLSYSPWNVNVVSAENELKIEQALDHFDGMFKPILVRTLPDGTLQVIGGEHRNEAAIRKGYSEVPIVNLGKLKDDIAMEMSLADNGRYGSDDLVKLSDLVQRLEHPERLSDFLPISAEEISASLSSVSIDLESLSFPDEQEAEPAQSTSATTLKTHQVMRFRVANADAETISGLIEEVMSANGLTKEDALTNAGDALVLLLKLHKGDDRYE